MVLIPAGPFLMGQDDFLFEKPQRKIHLDAFLIDRVPVTNGEYYDFCRATGFNPPPHWHAGYPPEGEKNHPVNNVTIVEARAFAKWAGKRIPTEAEWEKAARGTDGRTYPWGEGFDPKKCNADGSKIGNPVPVGSYPSGASPYGVLDMCGNLWEWVEGTWDPAFFEKMPARNPRPPADRELDILRGGAWSTLHFNCRTYSRCPALKDARAGYSGFRCAKSVK
jgi:serine/threonine-protein kinase